MKTNTAVIRFPGRPIQFVLVALVTVSLFSLVAGCYGGDKKPAVTNVVTAPTIQHAAESVAGGSFIVEPGKYKSFKLTVAPGMANPRLEGNFEASGGNNDVEVLLMESAQFLNWQNGHQAASVYSSGRVTADRLKVTLPGDAATYYLIFSNKFSYIRNKAVTADIKLQYDGSSGQ
jgi:hypothetical protein